MINICFHIGNISNCGGIERVTKQIADLLVSTYNDKYSVSILSNYYDEKDVFFGDNKKNQIKYFKLFSDHERNIKGNYFRYILKVKEFIKNNNIDVIISAGTIWSIIDTIATKNTRCKSIVWEHFNYYYNKSSVIERISKKIATTKADAFVVLTKKDKENYEQNMKIKNEIVTIYNPFCAKKDSNYRYNCNSNIILSSGRLTSQKGFDMLIEVAEELVKKNCNFEWIVLGEGPERLTLESLAKEKSVDKYVKFIGRVKDVESYYKKAKMFVMTSRYEGLPLVLLEAKTYSLPIISFDCNCGPGELIENSTNGVLIQPYEIKKMSEEIFALLYDNERCIKYSENAKKNMLEFDENVVVKKWSDLIDRLTY